MSKVTYIIKASEDALNEKTAAILVQVAKKDFITSSELREILEETMNASSVNSNIGVLIKKGLIEKSGDGLIITGEAQDIISKAAVIYAEENKPELLEKRTFGIRSLEVNNKGTFRIFGYKISEEHQKHFTDLGMSCRVAATGNTYLDIARTAENIETIIRSIKEL